MRPIWAKVAVDPITIPIARRLSNASAITPNKVTALAGLLARFQHQVNIRRILRIAGAMDSETARAS